jgi:hypothetical protein
MHSAWLALLAQTWGLAPSSSVGAARSWDGEVVARALHPVRAHPMADWHQAMSLAMEGPQASTLFRATSSRMDCHWRLSSTGPAPELTETFEQVVLDQALLGASLGLEATLRNTLDRSEDMAVIRRVIRTAIRPGIEWTGGDDGGEFRVDDHSRRGRMAMVELEDGRPHLPVSSRPPPLPQLRVGSGLRLVSSDDSDPLMGSLEIDADPALSTYAYGTHIGLDQVRLELLWVNPGSPSQDLGWEVVIRESLHPVVAWIGSLHGALDGELERARSTLEWHPSQAHPWVLRTGVSLRTDREVPVRVEISLQTRTRWMIPHEQSRWPLGLEPGARGPTWPRLPDRGPNELVTLGSPLRAGDSPEPFSSSTPHKDPRARPAR